MILVNGVILSNASEAANQEVLGFIATLKILEPTTELHIGGIEPVETCLRLQLE
jgi:hypothetical protein